MIICWENTEVHARLVCERNAGAPIGEMKMKSRVILEPCEEEGVELKMHHVSLGVMGIIGVMG